MRAEHSLVRQHVAGIGRLDQQHVDGVLAFEPPHRAARQHDVVAIAEFHAAVVAVQLTGAGVDEQQVVAVGVAHQVVHSALGLPRANPDMRVVHQLGRVPGRTRARLELCGIKRPRAQRPVEIHPPGRRMGMMHVAGRAEETFLAQFPLVRALGQVAMGLAGCRAFDFRMADPFLHVFNASQKT